MNVILDILEQRTCTVSWWWWDRWSIEPDLLHCARSWTFSMTMGDYRGVECDFCGMRSSWFNAFKDEFMGEIYALSFWWVIEALKIQKWGVKWQNWRRRAFKIQIFYQKWALVTNHLQKFILELQTTLIEPSSSSQKNHFNIRNQFLLIFNSTYQDSPN